jgi:serine/threonine protein kinase
LAWGTAFAGRYEIIEELGHGGMGKVYKVFDKETNSKVALKLIKPEVAADKNTIERFRNELKIARDISHKHICRMYDLGREADQRADQLVGFISFPLRIFLRNYYASQLAHILYPFLLVGRRMENGSMLMRKSRGKKNI